MIDKKKTKKADLESKKFIFTEIGLIIALLLTLYGFEYKTYEREEITLASRAVDNTQEEMIQITQQKIVTPPPAAPVMTTMIHIVNNDVEIEDELDIDVEADETTEVQQYNAPVEVKEEEEAEELEIFQVVEAMPEFPGGESARIEFLRSNIKYPQIAKESGIQGKVYVTFVVERDGSVTDVQILRGIGGGCDEEAVRVVKIMPKWNPGKQRNKPVRVQFNMPIVFQLQG